MSCSGLEPATQFRRLRCYFRYGHPVSPTPTVLRFSMYCKFSELYFRRISWKVLLQLRWNKTDQLKPLEQEIKSQVKCCGYIALWTAGARRWWIITENTMRCQPPRRGIYSLTHSLSPARALTECRMNPNSEVSAVHLTISQL